MTQPATTQKREFRLDRHAITSLIQAQAGSVEKALLEAVANAIDANATQVELEVSPTRISITDNGRGFANIEEIDKFFDTFGFDHSQLDRKVGRFGVGRGQLFNFGKNLWTTHGHTMAVDTQTDRFGYDLGVTEKPHKGVKIEIDLYQPLSFAEMANLETGFRKLVKYSTIPVIFNGEEIQKNPQDIKWENETDDAWIKLNDSNELKVYSQGLFVQSIPSYRYGKGGTIVTKMGRPLAQNMARNDLLTSECPVWKRVVKSVSKLSKDHQAQARKTGGALTEDMRTSLAQRALYEEGDEAFEILAKTPLFTLTNGKHIRLEALLSTGFTASAPNNDPAADLLIQRKQAMIINPGTLYRFGAHSVGGLIGSVKTAVKRHNDACQVELYKGARQFSGPAYEKLSAKRNLLYRLTDGLENCTVKERLKDLPMQANISLNEVKKSEYSAEEKQLMSHLRKTMFPWIERVVGRYLDRQTGRDVGDVRVSRSLALASSDAFLACTDGKSKVWLERGFLKRCSREGLQGFTTLANVMVHELLHDVDSSTGHNHDHEFYEGYHQLTLYGTIGRIALNEYRGFLRKGGKANNMGVKFMEEIQSFDPDDVESRLSSLKTGGDFEEDKMQSEAALPAKPTRKSKMRG